MGRRNPDFRFSDPLDPKTDPLAQGLEALLRPSNPLDLLGDPLDHFSQKLHFEHPLRAPCDPNLQAALETIARHDAVRDTAPVGIDVYELRRRLRLTQRQFARVFGFPVATLRHWERGDRQPAGPARVLLHVIRENPTVVLQAVRKARRR